MRALTYPLLFFYLFSYFHVPLLFLPILEHLCLISPSSLSPHFPTLHFIPVPLSLSPIPYLMFPPHSLVCYSSHPFTPVLSSPSFLSLHYPFPPSLLPSTTLPSIPSPLFPVPCPHSPVSLPPCPSHFLLPTFSVDERIAVFHVF